MPSNRFAKGYKDVYNVSGERDSEDNSNAQDADTDANDRDQERAKRQLQA